MVVVMAVVVQEEEEEEEEMNKRGQAECALAKKRVKLTTVVVDHNRTTVSK